MGLFELLNEYMFNKYMFFYVKLCMTKDIFTQLQVQLSKRKYSPL